MGRPVVHDQVDPQARGGVLVQHGQELHEGDGVVVPDPLGDDLPVRHVQGGDDRDGPVPDVPNSRRASRRARPGISGWVRDLAWMPVFSSMLIRTVPGGGFR